MARHDLLQLVSMGGSVLLVLTYNSVFGTSNLTNGKFLSLTKIFEGLYEHWALMPLITGNTLRLFADSLHGSFFTKGDIQ